MEEQETEWKHNLLNMFTEERLDIKFFIALHAKGPRDVIAWCIKNNLISGANKCPKCGKDMKLIARKDTCDRFVWQCRGQWLKEGHQRIISVRRNTMFDSIKISLSMSLLMTVMWITSCTSTFIKSELQLSDSTITEWVGLCREVCIHMCMRDSEAIGGIDIVVEIDVNEFIGKKWNKEKELQGKYVICGINSRTNKFFVRIVEDRTADNLLKVLNEFIIPGSNIISECWKSSDCLSQIEFLEFSKNKNVTFSDPPLVGGKTVEGTWKKIELELSKTRHVMNLFDEYKAEYIWRLANEQNNGKQNIESFFNMLRLLYPFPEIEIDGNPTLSILNQS